MLLITNDCIIAHINDCILMIILYSTLHNILIVVFEDWNNRVLTHKKKQFMIHNTYLCSRISNFLFGIYSMTCILYSISTMLISNDTNNTNNQLILNNKKLLLKMKFPFDFTIFPLYKFIIIAQFVFEYSVAFTAGMLMAFSAALVSWLFLIFIYHYYNYHFVYQSKNYTEQIDYFYFDMTICNNKFLLFN